MLHWYSGHRVWGGGRGGNCIGHSTHRVGGLATDRVTATIDHLNKLAQSAYATTLRHGYITNTRSFCLFYNMIELRSCPETRLPVKYNYRAYTQCPGFGPGGLRVGRATSVSEQKPNQVT